MHVRKRIGSTTDHGTLRLAPRFELDTARGDDTASGLLKVVNRAEAEEPGELVEQRAALGQ
jgi:hypothetical protein